MYVMYFMDFRTSQGAVFDTLLPQIRVYEVQIARVTVRYLRTVVLVYEPDYKC